MAVQSEKLRRFDNEFEEEIYRYLGQKLRRKADSYIVTSPFRVENREIDGLIITPHCLFTIEAKNVKGKIRQGLNTPMTAVLPDGRLMDFSDRHEDPVDQAATQWKVLGSYLKGIFDADGIFVKSLLVFPDGSAFDVNPDYRDFTNFRAEAFIVTLSEIEKVIDTFRPPFQVNFSPQAQKILFKTVREGRHAPSPNEKRVVAQSIAPPTSKQSPPRATPSYQSPPAPRPAPSYQTTSAVGGAATPHYETPPAPKKKKKISCLMRAILTIAAIFIISVVMGLWTIIAASEKSGGAATIQSILFESINVTVSPTTPGALDAPETEQLESVTTHTAPGTAVPGGQKRIQVHRGTSNVRSGPGKDFPIMDVAPNAEIYVILETSEDGFWYKIEITPGREGWIGSSRVKVLNPSN